MLMISLRIFLADFYSAVSAERRPRFFQSAGANWSRPCRMRLLVARPGICCCAAFQSASPEEASPDASNSETRCAYHEHRSRLEIEAAGLVADAIRAVSPAIACEPAISSWLLRSGLLG